MFSTNLKELRAEKSISQAELARILGMSQQAIAKWETEKATPDPDMIIKIADFFNVSTDYLLGHNEPMQKDKNLSLARERFHKKIAKISDEELLEIEKFLDYMRSRKEMDEKSTTA